MRLHTVPQKTQSTISTRIKVTLGYLLLTATLFAAVWFVVRSARSASEVSATERALAGQRQATTRLVAALLETQTLGENAALRCYDETAASDYVRSVSRADTAIAHLRRLTADTIMQHRLDSLQALLLLKQEETLRLVQALLAERGNEAKLQRHIEQLRSGRDVVKVGSEVEVPVVESGKEVVIERTRKGFFRRLGAAFRRAKADTLLVSTTTRQADAQPTQARVDISDTLADILQGIHTDMNRTTQRQKRRVNAHSDQLRSSGAELSQRIISLLEAIETAQQSHLQQAEEAERARRRASAWQMGALALAGTLAALLLLVRVWRDMARARQYRTALEEANYETRELMRRREQLLLTISHDIKAPVNSILGYINMWKSKTDDGQAATAIESSARHLSRLVLALLDYHKLEAGSIKPETDEVSLTPLLEEERTAFAPLAEEKGLQLTLRNELPADATLATDGFRLRQIIENLLSNAVKYTAQGGIDLRACAAQHGEVLIEVTDTGCGLTPHDAQRIFAPFTRAKGSEGQEGTGLGLSITQGLAKLLGGHISVRSTPGKGSTFTFHTGQAARYATATEHGDHAEERPTSASSSAPVAQTETPVLRPKLLPKPRLVYIIDDDTLQIQLTQAMLRNVLGESTEIRTFLIPDDLFCALRERAPQVLFTDIEMPALSGHDVLRRTHAMPGLASLPVVATTSHTLVAAEKFEQKGFHAVLFKPFTQNDLRPLFALAEEAPAKPPEHSPTTTTKQPELNLQGLLAFAEGDEEAARAILGQFAADTEAHRLRFAEALSRHDKAEICRLAHKLLPTFALIGSTAVPALRLMESRRGEAEWTPADEAPAREIAQAIDEALAALPNHNPSH